MTLKSKVELHGHPDLKVRASTDPIELDLRCEGAFKLATGPIRARIEKIPVTVRIPFLARAHGNVQAMTVGPFDVQIDPAEAKLKIVECWARAKIGKDGLRVDLTGLGACKFDVEMTAEMPTKALGAALKGALESGQES
jgi:hypothetical protein